MNWTDTGILLSTRKFGEASVIARALTPERGVCGGMVRAATGKKNRGILQPGNILSLQWQARLAEQLGTLTCELLTPHPALLMHDAAALSALQSACALTESALPEHHPYPRLYMALEALLAALHTPHWPAPYVAYELTLLAESGFGIDLTECAATGTTDNLIYVSPKSGRAVSRDAGAPYADKMLPLPAFLNPHLEEISPNPAEILAGLQLSGYFLLHWLLEPHGRTLPAVRLRLLQLLQKPARTG